MNTPAELHAYIHGYAEVICPFPPCRASMSEPRELEIEEEYHYYLLGRTIGMFSWLIIAKIIQEFFF